MPANGMIRAKTDAYSKGLFDGEQLGLQRMLDAALIAMARRGITGKALADFGREADRIYDEFCMAFRPCMEQDIWQERMDAELRDSLDDAIEFSDFGKRYPNIAVMGYDKPVREEKPESVRKAIGNAGRKHKRKGR